MNTGQIKQIRVLQMAHRTVGIRGHDVVGVEHGQRARQKFCDKTLTVQREQRGRQRDSFHLLRSVRPLLEKIKRI